MTPLDLSDLEQIQLEMDCTGCNGEGQVTKREVRITNSAMEHHQKKHAYAVAEGGNQLKDLPIGADCDCPRRARVITRTCTGCGGKKRRMYTFRLPKPGQKIEINNPDLLLSIFGEAEQIPEDPAVVHKVTHDEHGMYGFPGDIVVQGSWDRLLKNGGIPKGKQVDLWSFSLSEIRVVKK